MPRWFQGHDRVFPIACCVGDGPGVDRRRGVGIRSHLSILKLVGGGDIAAVGLHMDSCHFSILPVYR